MSISSGSAKKQKSNAGMAAKGHARAIVERDLDPRWWNSGGKEQACLGHSRALGTFSALSEHCGARGRLSSSGKSRLPRGGHGLVQLESNVSIKATSSYGRVPAWGHVHLMFETLDQAVAGSWRWHRKWAWMLVSRLATPSVLFFQCEKCKYWRHLWVESGDLLRFI